MRFEKTSISGDAHKLLERLKSVARATSHDQHNILERTRSRRGWSTQLFTFSCLFMSLNIASISLLNDQTFDYTHHRDKL